MRIRLTEAQAWETLARFFERRTRRLREAGGLCLQTDSLEFRGWLKAGVYYDMWWVIERAIYRHTVDSSGFIWPLDTAGAQARARFCWRQVKRLRER